METVQCSQTSLWLRSAPLLRGEKHRQRKSSVQQSQGHRKSQQEASHQNSTNAAALAPREHLTPSTNRLILFVLPAFLEFLTDSQTTSNHKKLETRWGVVKIPLCAYGIVTRPPIFYL